MNEVQRYREIERSDWYSGILLLVLFIVTITLSSVFLLPQHWYLWVSVVLGVTLLIVVWHTKRFAYRCPNCNEVFEISVTDNFLGPNHVTKKYLKCPKCGRRGWAQIMVIKK